MITLRPGAERGLAELDWLKSRHSFSFADYHDPDQMGVGDLRVINEDTIAPSGGFGTHGHKDMEIISYVLEGALQHRDTLGNEMVIGEGEVQRMSAGTGIMHSEYNASDQAPAHFFQIWVIPERAGIEPGYEQKLFSAEDKRGKLRLIISPDGREDSLRIHQDVALYASVLGGGDTVRHQLASGRRAWVQVARGAVTVNGTALNTGDGAAIAGEASVEVAATGGDDAEFILFDLR
ncbi:MAG: redox-sensitive bicupin YhaK (pirin superfamily) [Alphaproteobacteria bacterium]|jgi:redox-sensitive bicupin YhaK (pirin superfamily)